MCKILKNSLRLSSFLILLTLPVWGHAGVEEIFKEKTEIPEPLKLRDPFSSPKFKAEKKSGIEGKISKGVYSNVPSIGDVKLGELEIVGVIIGAERRAFARIKGKQETFTLKEGIKLGENKAVLKAIHPGGLVLVEKTTNIYGEDEYLETVIPISK